MEQIKKHINWSYGIALCLSIVVLVICTAAAIPSSNGTLAWGGIIFYYMVTFIGGQVVLSVKKRDAPRITMFIPPLFAIIVLALKNKKVEVNV